MKPEKKIIMFVYQIIEFFTTRHVDYVKKKMKKMFQFSNQYLPAFSSSRLDYFYALTLFMVLFVF